MPNWCQNQLTVTGATPEFRAWLENEGFSFEKMNPPSKPRRSNRTDWDGWAMLERHYTAWGTKWDLDDHEQREVASDLLDHGNAFFDTAWSPPIEAIEALSRKFPDDTLILDYLEPGMFFAGRATFTAGECCDECTQEKAELIRIARDVFDEDWQDEDDAETSEASAAA